MTEEVSGTEGGSGTLGATAIAGSDVESGSVSVAWAEFFSSLVISGCGTVATDAPDCGSIMGSGSVEASTGIEVLD